MHMELEKLKALLGIPQEDNSKDTALVFVMDQVEEIILNYCCVAEVPRGLLHTAYRMAMDIYRAESVGEAEPVTVTSITEGEALLLAAAVSCRRSRERYLKIIKPS